MGTPKGNIRKKKVNVTITITPYLKDRLDEMVESTDFSSISDLATMALTEFAMRYELKKKTIKPNSNTKILFDEDDNHNEHYIID